MGDDWRQDATRRAKVALIDTTAPNMARVGDYLYGGPNNFEADRKAARTLIAAAPATATIAPAARAFRQRVVRYLAGEARVTQFIDIGPGLAAPATPTRSCRPSLPRAASSTWTTTLWSWRTPAR